MSKAWPMVPLGEVLTERKEVPSSVDIETGITRIVSKIGFNEGKIELRSGFETKTGMILIQPGDIVVSGINAAKGAIAVYGEENTEPIAATIHYGAYILNKDRVDTKFLWWLLRSHTFRDLLSEYVPGGIKTELKARRLLPIPVPLPALSEQKRIVASIEELAAKIEEARGLRRQAVEEASIFERNSASRVFEKLVESHPLHPLGELVTLKGGGTPSKANPFFWNGSIPWISPKDMKSRELHDAVDHISEDAIKNSAAKLIEPGAVLVVVRGMILVHTFPSAILRTTATINQDMKALIPCSALLPEFLNCMFWAYNSRIVKLVEKSTHDTRRLDISKLLDTKIGLPGLPEQRRIVAYLDNLQAKVDALKRLHAETAAELNAMLPSVLDKVFKGELY